MPSAFDRFVSDDAAKFVDLTLFGVAATYTAAGENTGITINVSFSGNTINEALPGDPGTQDTQPMAVAEAADVPDASKGDKIVIDGETYYAIAALPDGFGHVVFTLATEDGYPYALSPHSVTTSYAGGSLSVPLEWQLPADPRRTAVQVWRRDNLGDGVPILVATLGADETSYTDTVPGESAYDYEIVAVGGAGPSEPAGIGIEVLSSLLGGDSAPLLFGMGDPILQ